VKFFRPFLKDEHNTMALKMWTQRDLDARRGSGVGEASINIQAFANTPGVRGSSNILVIMEEFAHFYNARQTVRTKPLDELIYEALVPSVSSFQNPDGTPFGKIYCISSPNGQTGKFYQEYSHAFKAGAESAAIGISIPTWEINPKVSPVYLRTQYESNPNGFNQEFGAEFTVSGQSWIKRLGHYYACVDRSLDARCEYGRSDRLYFVGVDFALSNDGTAITVGHWEDDYVQGKDDFCEEALAYNPALAEYFRDNGALVKGRYVIDKCEARYAGMPGPYEDQPTIDLDQVFDWLMSVYDNFPVQMGICDQWAGAIIAAEAQKRHLRRFEVMTHTQKLNDAMYRILMQSIMSGTLALPHDLDLHREMLGLVEVRHSGNMIKVEAPAGSQYHDDRFDSLIRCVFLGHKYRDNDKVLASDLPMLYKTHNRDKFLSVNGAYNSSIRYRQAKFR
jgi:hypothetical protein